MKSLKPLLFLTALIALGSCVTINVYFPAAAAERAAEQFVEDVLGDQPDSSGVYDPLDAQNVVMRLAGGLLDFMVADAHAQQPDFKINTPQINAIKSRMAQRQRQYLNGWFDSGAIGFSSDGLVVVRDRSAVALNERRQLESVVADENRDRRAVYREIAVANGQPDWEREIQQTWSQEWIRNARRGWYYQAADGSWKQK